MPNTIQTPPHKAAMRAVVTDMDGGDGRECLIWDATRSGCRISGDVDGLPDLVSVTVRGVAQPMKGRVVTRAQSNLGLEFVWSESDVETRAEQDAPAQAVVECDAEEVAVAETVAEPVEAHEAEAAMAGEVKQPGHPPSDEEIVQIYRRLERSILARLG